MKAVIYTRASNETGWVGSMAHQRRVCLEFAKEYGIEIAGIYEDAVRTPSLQDRTEFQRLMSDLQHGTIQFDMLLVSRFQYLTRNRQELYKYSSLLKKFDISIESVLEQPDEAQRQSERKLKEFLSFAYDYYLSKEKPEDTK